MDPMAAYEAFDGAYTYLERLDAAIALADWLNGGGFVPAIGLCCFMDFCDWCECELGVDINVEYPSEYPY